MPGSKPQESEYARRIVDDELDELFPHLAAIALEGPKGVGKTATAARRVTTTFQMDAPGDLERVKAAPHIVAASAGPVLIDEWQRYPPVWDVVRRAVDSNSRGGQFLLTGSATPQGAPVHSGAARIDSLRMRPLSFAERRLQTPTVSLLALFAGGAAIEGQTGFELAGYVHEIVASGFPGIRHLPDRARRQRLDGYIRRVVDHEVVEHGLMRRQPAQMLSWMSAYAAATGSTASNTTIGEAASTSGEAPARSTTERYRDALTQLWLLDPVSAWMPGNDFTRLSLSPKHFLADPALTARLLSLDEPRLLAGASTKMLGPQDRTVLGALFEALVALSLQTYAQAAEATVHHVRTTRGDHEVDFLLHRNDGTNIAVEVKLNGAPDTNDVRHLLWLKEQMGDSLADMVLINTGPHAYRRADGVAVVPLALIGA
jgi:predicted AAA+ superfamily ATPase